MMHLVRRGTTQITYGVREVDIWAIPERVRVGSDSVLLLVIRFGDLCNHSLSRNKYRVEFVSVCVLVTNPYNAPTYKYLKFYLDVNYIGSIRIIATLIKKT